MATLWGGRFSKHADALMEDFHSSIRFDQKLYYWDITGSKAHASMLAKQGIISEKEKEAIINGLDEILQAIENHEIEFDPSDEDIHMNIERLLTKKIGDTGKKLHTARSRNDQVAVDTKLYVRHEVKHTMHLLQDFLDTLLATARKYEDVIMPGYTHLQRAQPILFAHHMLAYMEMFSRDMILLQNWIETHNTMPLGSGALAGTTFPIDRNYTAQLLDFSMPTLNSMDGVSDRDFILDFLYAASRSMMHLSRFCEEIILWSTHEFSFITLDDAYSTGSSIMPQKKNPDVAELVRGKTGRVYGNLMALLTTMKGLPLAYNKDMQEDKEGLFDTVETWQKCLIIFSKMIETMTVNKEAMLKATKGGFTNATDLADYLAKKGVPFREAHEIVGKMVAHCIMEKNNLEDLSLEEMQVFSSAIEDDIYHAIAIETCVNERNSFGGPGPDQVKAALQAEEDKWKVWKEKYNL